MQTTESITMFHLSRKDGTAVFLHPFLKRGSTDRITTDTVLTGSYGREPRVESLTLLRNDLYRRIESDVRDWINERRFIPRFLIAAGAFLIVFLFLAAVIRDPIPVLDETLISLGVGIAVFVIVGRRFEQSKVAGQKRVMMRTRVDQVVFSEDPYVREMEEILHRCEEIGYADAVESQDLLESARALRTRDVDKTSRILEYLRVAMNTNPYKPLERALRKGRDVGRLKSQIDTGVLAPGLVALFHVLQKSANEY
jgi:hypothetical protein